MNEIIKTEDSFKPDLFDRSVFPFYKQNNIELYNKVQSNTVKKLIESIFKSNTIKEVVTASDSMETIESVSYLVANIDEYTQSMIDKGEWILKVRKDETGFVPTLYDQAGDFAKQLSLENKDIDVKSVTQNSNLQNALSNLYMQQQINEIISQLEILNSTLQRVERGQLDDRIGLYLSAKQQFLEALNIENESLKQLTLSNAIKSANDARFQLMQSAYSNIMQIVQPKNKKVKVTDELLNNVRESMQYINEATQLCVSAYSIQKEEKAQIATLQSYQNFIETAFLQRIGDRSYSQILHTNWSGKDSSWLEFPATLNTQIQQIVSENKLYLERDNKYEKM